MKKTKILLRVDPLLDNGSTYKHVSVATREYSKNARNFFYVVSTEMLKPGLVSYWGSVLLSCCG
jgi:hypothetical protein